MVCAWVRRADGIAVRLGPEVGIEPEPGAAKVGAFSELNAGFTACVLGPLCFPAVPACVRDEEIQAFGDPAMRDAKVDHHARWETRSFDTAAVFLKDDCRAWWNQRLSGLVQVAA
jgi:hypothetical protein